MQISEQQAQELTAHERRAERARDEGEVIITEIQERITPQALAGKAGNAVKEATVGRVGRAVDDMTDKVSDTGGSFVGRIRQNPIPAVLVGTGHALAMCPGDGRSKHAAGGGLAAPSRAECDRPSGAATGRTALMSIR